MTIEESLLAYFWGGKMAPELATLFSEAVPTVVIDEEYIERRVKDHAATHPPILLGFLLR